MSADTGKDRRRAAKAGKPDLGGAAHARQKRVGILRNPNRVPVPPPRRAPLTGKWLSMRSSRRADPAMVEAAAQMAEAECQPPITATKSAIAPSTDVPDRAAGRMAHRGGTTTEAAPSATATPRAQPDASRAPAKGIDIAQLTAAVAELGEKKSQRRSYAEGIAPTRPTPGPAAAKATAGRDGDDESPHAAACQSVDGGAHSLLPPLAKPGREADEISARDASAQPASTENGAGRRLLLGLMVLGIAGLAVTAMLFLPGA